MSFLHSSPEKSSSSRLRPQVVSAADRLPPLLQKIETELAHILKASVELSPAVIELTPSGEDHFSLGPKEEGKEIFTRIGFENFSKAAQLAMVSEDWGIVKTVSPESNSLEIFIPRSSSKRQ